MALTPRPNPTLLLHVVPFQHLRVPCLDLRQVDMLLVQMLPFELRLMGRVPGDGEG